MTDTTVSEFPSGWRQGYELLADIHHQAFSAQGDRPWAASEFRDIVESPGASILIEHEDDLIRGFILTRAVCDEAEVISVAVAPAFQNGGTGGRLLDSAIKALSKQGVAKIFLEVREDNLAAIRLYRSRGFQETGKRPGYYQTQGGNSIDALCFALILGN